MKSRSISLNESKLSDLESEEGIFDFNDNLTTYVELLNKRINLKNYYGFPADFYIKDQILEIGYIISEPLWIINSLNYSPYGFIKINQEHQNLINNESFCGFISKNNFYLLVYNQRNIFLYDCNYLNNRANNKKINLIFNISLNAEKDENIINAQFLPNDLGKTYFIIITDRYNSYLLNINMSNMSNGNTNNINYNFEQIKDKYSQSILAKSFSSIWPFNSLSSSQNNNNIKISNCFIISPHRQLKKNNSLYTYYNTLFLLSNDTLTLKYIAFSINNNSILPIIENIKDLSKDISSHFANINKKFISKRQIIYSVDSFFNENKKILYIYCFLGLNDCDEKYILRIIVDNNFNINFDTLDVSDKIEKNNIHNFQNCKIFVNNYSDEGILVIPNDVIINFNYCNGGKNENINGWKSCINFKHNILGINKFNQYGIFNLDLFTSTQGIINFNPTLCYSSPDDIKGKYKIEQSDKTAIFLSNFLKGQLIKINKSNIIDNNFSLNKSFQSNSSIKKSINLKPYEVILQNNKKSDFYSFLDEIIKKYLKKNSYINVINEKDQFMINKFNSFFNAENIIENDQKGIQDEFFDYIQGLVNDDKIHIDIMEKSRKKIKLLTVQYLQEKYNKVMILYHIARKCIIEGIEFFEFYPDLLNKFFKIFEKLIIGMAINKQENILFEKNGEGNNNLISIFLDNFYEKIKEKMGNKDDIYHLKLFGKIDNIDHEFLEIFFETFFYILNSDINEEANNMNLFLIQKDNLFLFIVNIILEINDNIQKLMLELNPDRSKNKLIKYNNGLWFLSENNDIANKYLLKIFRYICSWKIETFKDSKIDNDAIFLYGEQLHFLIKNYLLIGNNSPKDKLDFINTQKNIDEILCAFDKDRTYQLSKKYLDDYILSKIAFSNKEKYYPDLKIFMKKELEKKRGHIKYILQLILQFEIEYIHNCEDCNNIIFNFFEEFSSFEKEITEIINFNKKAQNFFNSYLLQKNLLNKIIDENLVEKIVSEIKKEAEINDDINNKNKVKYLVKILGLDKIISLMKESYLNNKDEEKFDNNEMIIE